MLDFDNSEVNEVLSFSGREITGSGSFCWLITITRKHFEFNFEWELLSGSQMDLLSFFPFSFGLDYKRFSYLYKTFFVLFFFF